LDFLRGEILYDKNFVYPDGGSPCDKLLLVVNKKHVSPEEVILIPAKTNTRNYPYVPNCNETEKAFYFDQQVGFYLKNTIIQLDQIISKPVVEIEQFITNTRIKQLCKSTTTEELNRILNCLKKMKDDIPGYIYDLVF
jgi:hypothetical protein